MAALTDPELTQTAGRIHEYGDQRLPLLARALDLHHDRGGRADQQPRRARAPSRRSSTENSRLAPKATTMSDSPNALSRPPQPADSNAARCSPISANSSQPTPAAIHSPHSHEPRGVNG